MSDDAVPAVIEGTVPVPTLESAASGVIAKARAVVVSNAADYEAAAALCQGWASDRATLEAELRPNIKRWHEGHGAALAQLKRLDAPFNEAIIIVKGQMLRWKREEDERAEKLRRELAAQQKKEEDDRRIAEAEELAEAGEPEAAEEVLTAPSIAPPVRVAPSVPQVGGVKTQGRWKAEVTDKKKLVAAIAAGTVPLAAVDVNTTVLRQHATALKEELKWPGVRVYKEDGLAIGAKR